MSSYQSLAELLRQVPNTELLRTGMPDAEGGARFATTASAPLTAAPSAPVAAAPVPVATPPRPLSIEEWIARARQLGQGLQPPPMSTDFYDPQSQFGQRHPNIRGILEPFVQGYRRADPASTLNAAYQERLAARQAEAGRPAAALKTGLEAMKAVQGMQGDETQEALRQAQINATHALAEQRRRISPANYSDFEGYVESIKTSLGRDLNPEEYQKARQDWQNRSSSATRPSVRRDIEADSASSTGFRYIDRGVNAFTGAVEWERPGGEAPKPSTGPSTEMTPTASASIFNSIVRDYARSPLVAASNRTVPLASSVQAVRSNPSDGAKQITLIYGFIQALDTYQSAVREGEIRVTQETENWLDSTRRTLARMAGSNEVLGPQAIASLTNEAERLVNDIRSAAQQQSMMYKSQAETLGMGDKWSQFLGGFTPIYNTPTSAPLGLTQPTTPAAFSQPTGGDTATQQDILNYAQAEGISPDEARRRIEAEGYRIQ